MGLPNQQNLQHGSIEGKCQQVLTLVAIKEREKQRTESRSASISVKTASGSTALVM